MFASSVSAHDLRGALRQARGIPIDGPTASVAAVFRGGESGTELLFIQRASKDSDPWSGHMAFPGGRTDPGDHDSFDTAERETLEEVGLDLSGVPRLGSLDDLVFARDLRAVHAQAYWLDGERPTLAANYEVADILWVPLSVLGDRSRYIDYQYPVAIPNQHRRPVAMVRSSWPGIQLDKPSQVVWGLTLRFLDDLFRRLSLPFIEVAPLTDAK